MSDPFPQWIPNDIPRFWDGRSWIAEGYVAELLMQEKRLQDLKDQEGTYRYIYEG